MKKIILIYIALIGLIWAITVSDRIAKIPLLESSLRAGVLLLFIFIIIRTFIKEVAPSTRVKEKTKNRLLLGISISCLLMLLEGFYGFMPRSHANDFTKASQLWYTYYWEENDHGYRDEAYVLKDTTKKAVVFIGDSFTAGHGIKDPGDRFANIVGNKNDKYEYYVLAKNGWGPEKEYEAIDTFRFAPEIVILQYYGNDIKYLAMQKGKKAPKSHSKPPAYLRFLLEGSYLFNYFYYAFPENDAGANRRFLVKAYQDEYLLEAHFVQLEKIIHYCRDKKATLFVVLFPFPDNYEESKVYTDPIHAFFKTKQVEVINVAEITADLPMEKRIVSPYNLHANETVHQRISEEILKRLP